MSYVNTTRKSRLIINGVDESSRMISWTVNDDSVFKNGIMRTVGTVVLGTTNLSQYDYRRTAYKRGQIVTMEIWNNDLAQYEYHPRGFLYVLSTSFDASSQQVSIEIGCQLAAWTLSDNIDQVYSAAGVELDGVQRTIENISQALYSRNELIYQDNTGTIVKKQAVALTSPMDPVTLPSNWSTGSQTEAISSQALQNSDEIPDIVTLNYSAVTSAGKVDGENTKTTTDTSNYDIFFEALTWVRDGTGEELSGTDSIDDSFDGTPGAAIGTYQSVSDLIKVNTSRTETTTEVFGAVGGQVSSKTQEVYQPGTEVNEEYFKDKYSACRYTCSVDGDADCVGCSYLQATSPMLASRIITTYTYDSAGTVTQERVERWLPILAAAQSFNWKEEGAYGQPLNFQEISLDTLYRDSVVITDYSQVDGKNVEQITAYRSAAVEYNAGIYATQESIGGSELGLGPVTAAPVLLGEAEAALATVAVTGTGTGMTVNAVWPTTAGLVEEITITSSLSDCQYALKPSSGYIIGSTTGNYFDGPVWTLVGGSGWIDGESIDITGGAQGSGFAGKIDIYYTTGSGSQYIRFYPNPGTFNGPGYGAGQAVVFRGLSSGQTWATTLTAGDFLRFGPTLAYEERNGAVGQRDLSGGLFWQALPLSGGTDNGAWTGGSGSGFAGYVKDGALPTLKFNSSNFSYDTAGSWNATTTSTDFVGSATSVIQIEEAGSGYEVGDVLTWSQSFSQAEQFGSSLSGLARVRAGSFGQQISTTTITGQVTAVGQGFPTLTIADPGSGYVPGDQVKITAAALSAAVGYPVTDDVLFTILTTEAGAPNLGEGIASLGLTNYTPPTPTALQAYAGSGGTTVGEYLFEQTYGPTTTITNTGTGANGSVNVSTYAAYAPYGEGIVSPFQISSLSTHGSGGALFLDNPFMLLDMPALGTTTPFTFEGWYYVEDVGASGAVLFTINRNSWPSIPSSPPFSFNAAIPTVHIVRGTVDNEPYLIGRTYSITSGTAYFTGANYNTPCPIKEWFHIAVSRRVVSASSTTWNTYLNGKLVDGSVSIVNTSSTYSSSDKIYIGCGQWDPAGSYSNGNYVSYRPDGNNDYIRMAVDQVRVTSGAAIYSTTSTTGGQYVFTPVSLGPLAPPDNSLQSGIYENIPLTSVTGSGKAATANLEVITDGGASVGGTTMNPVFVTPAIAYTESLGVAETATDGAGEGLKVEIGLGFSGDVYSTKTPVVIRSVVDGGKNYVPGDRVKVQRSELYRVLSESGLAGTIDGDLELPASVDYTSGGGAWLFPEIVGTGYAVSDTVSVTADAVRASGAGDPGTAIQATVTAVTPPRDLQTLTLDALEGVKRITVNISNDDSNLADLPDTNATTQLPTSEFTTSLTLRTDAYLSSAGFLPDTTDETLQVPTGLTDGSDVVKFVEDYKTYFKSFTLGEAYGFRIGEGLRDEIMTSWEPMTGFRYTDERTDVTFAMRADAATWGVDSNEAAVVYNGLWFGDVSLPSSLGTSQTIDGGNFTADSTLATDSDTIDGGNFTAGSSSAVDSQIYDGGPYAENPFDIGKVMALSMGVTFDATTTFTLGLEDANSTQYPLFIDWEGTAIVEEVNAADPSHSYVAGTYTLSVMIESSDIGKKIRPYMYSTGDEAKVTSLLFGDSYTSGTSMADAFRGCTALTSVVFTDGASVSAVGDWGSAFRDCSNLVTWSGLTYGSTTFISLNSCWLNCSSLVNFPARQFDHIQYWSGGASAGASAFAGCALSSGSIENILVSLDTCPAGATTFDINGGTNAAYGTWSDAAKSALTSLQGKGWTINYNA